MDDEFKGRRRQLKMVPTDEELFRRFVRSQERIAESLERIDAKLASVIDNGHEVVPARVRVVDGPVAAE